MFRLFTSATNLMLMELVADSARQQVHDPTLGESWAVFYGSHVVNQANAVSDIDLLLISDRQPGPQRLRFVWNQASVTTYVLSRSDFESDGSRRAFGGYFTAKLLHPYVSFPNDPAIHKFLADATAAFIAPFAAHIGRIRGDHQVTKHAVLADAVRAYLDICPAYLYYLIRLYDTADFPKIWEKMAQVITDAMLRQGLLLKHSGRGLSYLHIPEHDEFHSEIVKTIARFWAFGAVCHDSNYRFPDQYFERAEAYLREQRAVAMSESMMEFFRNG